MRINKERIKFLIKKQSLKQKDVAVKIGVNPQDFTNWMFRGIFPHYNKLEELASILEADISTLYLSDNVAEPEGVYNKKYSFDTKQLIPFIEADPQYGLSALWKNGLDIAPKDYVYIPGLHADIIVSYFGKGMEPKLENGDWIALRKLTDYSFFNFGSIHAILTKEQILVRTLKKGTEPDTITLVGTLTESNEITLPINAIKAVYTVVSIIKRNLI